MNSGALVCLALALVLAGRSQAFVPGAASIGLRARASPARAAMASAADDIRKVWSEAKTVAVVGATTKEDMPVFRVMQFLINEGYTCYPVNPRIAKAGGDILGQPAVATLSDITDKVDIVDIFMRSDRIAPIIDEAITIKAGCVWTQIGVQDDEAAQKARLAGLTVIQNRCPAIDIPVMGIETPRSRL